METVFVGVKTFRDLVDNAQTDERPFCASCAAVARFGPTVKGWARRGKNDLVLFCGSFLSSVIIRSAIIIVIVKIIIHGSRYGRALSGGRDRTYSVLHSRWPGTLARVRKVAVLEQGPPSGARRPSRLTVVAGGRV